MWTPGEHVQTHLLDLFGPILDPIGYRLDLSTYYDDAEIPVRPQSLPPSCSDFWWVRDFGGIVVLDTTWLSSSLIYVAAAVVCSCRTYSFDVVQPFPGVPLIYVMLPPILSRK